MLRLGLACTLLLFPTVGRASPEGDRDGEELPQENRPEHFSGAVGHFQVSVAARPTELQAEDPVTFTVHVSASGPVRQPPARPDLRDLAEFTSRFYIEDLPTPPGQEGPGPSWDFVYRLKPRDDKVTLIPALPFTFFNADFLKPGTPRPSKGYQTIYADEIPLTVRSRDQVQVAPPGQNLQPAPESVYRLAEGTAVLGPRASGLAGMPMVLLLILMLPPAVCLAWYRAWCRIYPDAARLARQRRSRAARQALKALRAAGRKGSTEQASRTAVIVADYLRQRLDLTAAEPTPAEAASHLLRIGCSKELAGKVSELFRACDMARFAPEKSPDLDGLVPLAERFVLGVEAERWQS